MSEELDQLHMAAQDGDLVTVKKLVEDGKQLNIFDEIGKTPLHYAVEGEHMEIVRYLIDSGADVNAHDEIQIGNTPLGECAQTCSFEMAKMLLEVGADPTIPGWMQLTAIDRASKRKRGDGPKVYLLLKKHKKRGA